MRVINISLQGLSLTTLKDLFEGEEIFLVLYAVSQSVHTIWDQFPPYQCHLALQNIDEKQHGEAGYHLFNSSNIIFDVFYGKNKRCVLW